MKRRPQQYVMKLLKRTNPMAFSCLCIFNNKSPLLSLKCSSQCVPSHPDLSLSSLLCFGDPSLFKRKPLQSAAAFKMVCLGCLEEQQEELQSLLFIWRFDSLTVVEKQFLVSFYNITSETRFLNFYSLQNCFFLFWNFVNLFEWFIT